MRFWHNLLIIQYYSAFALQIAIAAGMFWRRLYGQAKFFFIYIVWQTISVAVMYVFLQRHLEWHYFYGYWINNTITVALGMAIVLEIFKRTFAPYEAIRRIARIVFVAAAGLLIIVSAIFLFYHNAEYSRPILTFFLVTERSVRIMQLGLILCLFGISRYLHLRWKNYLFGIALGFGFYALMDLVALVVRMTYGQAVAIQMNVLFGTAYCAAVVIWTVYVLQPEAAKIPIASLPSHELEQWDQTLRKMLSRKDDDPFR